MKFNSRKEIDKFLSKEYSDFQNLNNRYVYLKGNKKEEVKKRLQPLPENLERIENIKKTSEYKDAAGELEVIKNLENLPEDYFCSTICFWTGRVYNLP